MMKDSMEAVDCMRRTGCQGKGTRPIDLCDRPSCDQGKGDRIKSPMTYVMARSNNSRGGRERGRGKNKEGGEGENSLRGELTNTQYSKDILVKSLTEVTGIR